jgi:plasmid stabilization system protein ParE
VRCRVWATPQAIAQALAADTWWRKNRPASPELFFRELTGATDLLADAPEVGRRYLEASMPGLRRLLLPKTRYHVYYVHASDKDEIAVLAVWSAVRGRGPRLGG